MLRTALIALAALAMAPAANAQQAPATLTIELTGLAPQGTVMLQVFDSEAGYQSGQGVAQARAEITGQTATLTIPNLAPGQYAVRLFHDTNGNGRMDTNPFGIPTEPFAFSNNARGQFGPARWADAAFEVTAQGATQRINVGGR